LCFYPFDAALIHEVQMMKTFSRDFTALVKETTGVLYHILVVALSAGVALSLPVAAGFLSQDFSAYWSVIQNDRVALIALEVAVAILLIASINYLRRSIKDRKTAEMAEDAGLTMFFLPQGLFAQRKIKRLKRQHGLARNIMIIGSTGYRTFVHPHGDLHTVLENCLEAKIMLLNPFSEAARARAKAILGPDITLESFQEQVGKCIEFLKQLRAAQKSIQLKLYSDPPHFKLTILGDYIWQQHYHPSRDVHVMPEYVFKHTRDDLGLYAMFYQYFIKRWESPEIPEYDFETDELVYRESNGNIARRERFLLEAETMV
jgi:hypothetical protein